MRKRRETEGVKHLWGLDGREDKDTSIRQDTTHKVKTRRMGEGRAAHVCKTFQQVEKGGE